MDYLVTWNTRHFQKKAVRDYAQFPILTPGEFLEEFRRAGHLNLTTFGLLTPLGLTDYWLATYYRNQLSHWRG